MNQIKPHGIKYREYKLVCAPGTNLFQAAFFDDIQSGDLIKGSLELSSDYTGFINYGVSDKGNYYRFGSIKGLLVKEVKSFDINLSLQPKMKFMIELFNMVGDETLTLCLFGFGNMPWLI